MKSIFYQGCLLVPLLVAATCLLGQARERYMGETCKEGDFCIEFNKRIKKGLCYVYGGRGQMRCCFEHLAFHNPAKFNRFEMFCVLARGNKTGMCHCTSKNVLIS